jgi:hypothetical protein
VVLDEMLYRQQRGIDTIFDKLDVGVISHTAIYQPAVI